MSDIETTATVHDPASAGASTSEVAPTAAPIGAEADTPSIGQRIRAARETRGMTMAELGARAGTSKYTISKIELCKITDSSFLPPILEILGLSPDLIVEDARRRACLSIAAHAGRARRRAGERGEPQRNERAAGERLRGVRRRAAHRAQQVGRDDAAGLQPGAASRACAARGAEGGDRQGARADPQGPPAGLLDLRGRPLLPPRQPQRRPARVHPHPRRAGDQEPVRDGGAVSRFLPAAAVDAGGQCARAFVRRTGLRLQGRHRRHPRGGALRHRAAPARLRGGVLAARADPRRRGAADGARRGRHRGDPGIRPPTAPAISFTRCGATPRPG